MEFLINLFTIINKYHKGKIDFKKIYEFAIDNTIEIPKASPEELLKKDISNFLDNIILNEEIDLKQEENIRKKWLIKYALDMSKLFESHYVYESNSSLIYLSNFLYGDYQKKLSEELNKSNTDEKEIIFFNYDVEIEISNERFIKILKQKEYKELLYLPKDKIYYNLIEGLSWIPDVGGIDDSDHEYNSPQEITKLIRKVQNSYDKFVK